jgi:hypothetical protein
MPDDEGKWKFFPRPPVQRYGERHPWWRHLLNRQVVGPETLSAILALSPESSAQAHPESATLRGRSG